jgi:8-oxo-dGTP diphosphatase
MRRDLNQVNLRYTLCFCRQDGLVLMLYRARPPHQGMWNGTGGKIELGETPLQGVQREVAEETGLMLRTADFMLRGIVTWPVDEAVNGQGGGMYVYTATVPAHMDRWPGARTVADGQLAWIDQQWVCDPANRTVVENIPYFLGEMLAGAPIAQYDCDFAGDQLRAVVRYALPAPSETTHQHHSTDDEGDPGETLWRYSDLAEP